MASNQELTQLYQQVVDAHKAGDKETANRLVGEYNALKSSMEEQQEEQEAPLETEQQEEQGSSFSNFLSGMSGLAESIGQSLTGGFSDEIQSGIEAGIHSLTEGVPFGETYRILQEQRKQQRDQFSEDHPIADLSGRLAGGVVMPMPGAAATTLLGRAAQGGAAGAGYGMLYGAGEADTASDIPEQALSSGAIGGALGAGLPAAIDTATALSRLVPTDLFIDVMSKLGRKVNPKPADQEADEIIAQAIQADSPQSALRQNLQDLAQEPTNPNQIVAERGGESLQGLLQATANQPGEGRRIISEKLLDRAKGQVDRVKESIKKNIHPRSEEAELTIQKIKKERDAQADKDYEDLNMREVEIHPDDDLVHFMRIPEIARLYRRAVKESNLREKVVKGKDAIRFKAHRFGAKGGGEKGLSLKKQPSKIRPVKMAPMDMLKRLLYQEEQAAARSGDNNMASVYGQARERLVKHLDQIPGYPKARKNFERRSRQMEAIEKGQKSYDLLKEGKDPKLFLEDSKNIRGSSEAEFFRQGLGSRMLQEIDNTKFDIDTGSPKAGAIDNIDNTIAQRSLTDASLPKKKARSIRGDLESERQFSETKKKTLDGSKAGIAQSQAERLKEDTIQGVTASDIQYARTLRLALSGKNDTSELRKSLAKKLTAKNLDDYKPLLVALEPSLAGKTAAQIRKFISDHAGEFKLRLSAFTGQMSGSKISPALTGDQGEE